MKSLHQASSWVSRDLRALQHSSLESNASSVDCPPPAPAVPPPGGRKCGTGTLSTSADGRVSEHASSVSTEKLCDNRPIPSLLSSFFFPSPLHWLADITQAGDPRSFSVRTNKSLLVTQNDECAGAALHASAAVTASPAVLLESLAAGLVVAEFPQEPADRLSPSTPRRLLLNPVQYAPRSASACLDDKLR